MCLRMGGVMILGFSESYVIRDAMVPNIEADYILLLRIVLVIKNIILLSSNTRKQYSSV